VGARDVVVTEGAAGVRYVHAVETLGDYPRRITARLEHWAATVPDRVFLAERRHGGEWRRITYAETLAAVRALGQALLDRGLSPERPVVILSGNDIEHALLGLAAMHVGVPYAPVSPAYSLVSSDHERLRGIFRTLTPGLVYVADAAAFRSALDAVVAPDVEIVAGVGDGMRATPFAALGATSATAAVERAAAAVGPDTVAKFLFTSGSTGRPKAVINTQRMLCSNQQMLRQCFAFLADEPPVLLDWSPWSHTAGGNHNFGMVLYNGGTFYIDGGKPTPAGAAETARNLREIAPTWYFNVPKGYEALLPHLQADEQVRQTFFSRVRMLYVAGAGLSQHVWDEINRAAVETCGEQILLTGGLGATETAPFALVCTWQQEHADNCGLPAPGLELKLVPVDGKLEACMRGPNVTPGYWREPELTAAAFDAEGYYRLGDAVRYADPADIRRGLLFDGRIAENFKLATGTWVSTGALRQKFLQHFRPFVHDVVLTGLNRDYLGALVFPDIEALKTLAGDDDLAPAALVRHPEVKAKFVELLRSHARAASGSSNRIERALLLAEPPSPAAGEITDKGSVNQRAVSTRRAASIEALYRDPVEPDVITIAEGKS
jgi:feruloyl-CoA synthase